MHLTVRKYRKVEGDKNQPIELVNREFLPVLAKIDGFVDFYGTITEDGSILSVSVFEDAKGAEESVRAAASWVQQALAKELPEKPEVTTGEVFAHRHLEKKKAA